MRVLILAAGQGSRLRPLTNDRPKSMVELAGSPLISHQIEVLLRAGVAEDSIAIVTGYRKEFLEGLGFKTFFNMDYLTTNMVHSLFCASDWMKEDQDLLITYGDIVYDQIVLDGLIGTDGEIVLAADRLWQKLWAARAENYLEDAETFRIAEDGSVSEVGNRPHSLEDIDAQYMGLIKVRADKVSSFLQEFLTASLEAKKEGRNINNIYMTDFINALIRAGWQVMPSLTSGHWIEVDTVADLELYKGMLDPENPKDLMEMYRKILE